MKPHNRLTKCQVDDNVVRIKVGGQITVCAGEVRSGRSLRSSSLESLEEREE